jgi:hypothetical protein
MMEERKMAGLTPVNKNVGVIDNGGSSNDALDRAVKNYNPTVAWNAPIISGSGEQEPTPPPNPNVGKPKGLTVSEYYNNILAQLGGSGITPEKITYEALGYEMPTEVEIAQKISEYLRPNYDRAISSRRAQTTQNRAALDIDAASRGMGSSTWLTDAKNRQALAEAADIAGLESDYGTNLAQNVYNMYNQHLTNKLNVGMFDKSNQLSVDQQNVANALAAAQWREETAYARALDAYNLAKSRAGSGITDTTGVTIS